MEGGRIVDVGPGPPGRRVEDLGNVALLPGLINAHAHLEFSDLTRPIGEPGIAFTDWIRRVVQLFRQGRRSSAEAVRHGLRESVLAGTTTLGEIAQPGWPANALRDAEIDVTVFLELIAPTAQRIAPLLDLASQHVSDVDPSCHWRAGLSPHAPYTVLPELLAAAVSLSAARRVPLAMHLAESREEIELLRHGRGPFVDRAEELGTCDPRLFPPGGRPLDYLRRLAAAHRALVIHGNYLDEEEIAFLADCAGQMAVVYCPRTHAFFGHDPYPLRQMLEAGVLVALGTDSRASSPDLSVLAEMRLAAASHAEVDREQVLRLGTLHAARALGVGHEVGSLEPGKQADLVVVDLPERDDDPYRLLFDADLPVVGSWRRGTPRGGPSPMTG